MGSIPTPPDSTLDPHEGGDGDHHEAPQFAYDWLAMPRSELAPQIPRNSSERHLIETGHRLAFGCCARSERRG